MSSSLLQRFQATRESAPVESPLDKPASIHDDAGNVVDAVEPASPDTHDRTSGPGLHAPGLPAEPVTKPVDAAGVAKDETADKNVVAAVKPAKPSSSDASGLPGAPVKEAKSDAAACADEHADAEGKTAAAVQSVTPHHTTEDLDPEAAQVEPATCIEPMPDHARETEAAYRAVEDATLHSAMEEFERVQDGLEALRERIEGANQSGGLTAESAFFAHFAVESLLKRFNVKDEKTTGSFESAVILPEGKSVVNLESLDATLEGVDNVGQNVWQRAVASVGRSFRPLVSRVKLAGKSLGSVIREAEKIRGGRGGEISVKKRYVLQGDSVPSDVGKAFEEAAEKLHYLTTTFTKQAQADFKDNIKTLEELRKTLPQRAFLHWRDDWNKDASSFLAKVWERWKDPRTKLGGDPSAPIIGNYAFFEDQGDKYGGSDGAAKKFDAFANKAYPTLSGYQHKRGDHEKGSVSIHALSPQQIIAVAKRLQEACQGITFLRGLGEHTSLLRLPFSFGRFKAGNTIERQGYHTRLYETERGSDGTIKTTTHEKLDHPFMAVEDALKTSQRLTYHVGYDAGRVLADTIAHFLTVAKASLNAHAKASTEAFDQQNSVDGVSVNETAPNEPVQVPAKGHTAIPGELMAKQDSWEDKPASFQTIEDEAACETIDFEEAAASCESLIEEASEIGILQQHYATEDEASGEAKPHPGMVERIKGWIAKLGEFFKSVWRRIVQFVTQQSNRLMDWAAKVRKHHFEKVTVKLSGSENAYINDMKLPNLSAFYDFMDEAASAGEDVAKKLEHHSEKQQNLFQGRSSKLEPGHLDAALDSNVNFMTLGSENPIPAEGMVGAFKLSVVDGKLVETQVAKKVEGDKDYTVTGSSLASFVDGAAKLIKKAEARVKAFEMKSDADWKRAKEAADKLGPSAGLFNLKPYGETARYLMKAFAVLQHWARQVGAFAEKCIKGAGEKLNPAKQRDDTQDAEFSIPAAESLQKLPYWYRPATA